MSRGLKPGNDFFLAFSPEREDPGNPQFSAPTIPKVVGGLEPASLELAVALYGKVVVRVVPVSSTEVAEACKILENTYRAINIALVNELKMLYDRMGINVWEVIEAAKSKPFGFQAFYPGPGLGGHCIPIDPFYLTWVARRYGLATRFIELAGEINTAMPAYVVSKVADALNDSGKPVKGSKITLLGMAYKKDVDDPRESPGFELMDLLLQKGSRGPLQRPPHLRAAPDAPLSAPPDGQPGIDAGVPRVPGLCAHRHGPLGLRLALDCRACAADRRHPQRHERRCQLAGQRSSVRKDRGCRVLACRLFSGRMLVCANHRGVQ